eukprot:g26881.t1
MNELVWNVEKIRANGIKREGKVEVSELMKGENSLLVGHEETNVEHAINLSALLRAVQSWNEAKGYVDKMKVTGADISLGAGVAEV